MLRASTTMGASATASRSSSTESLSVLAGLRSMFCSCHTLSRYRMRIIWRPEGNPARANAPAESLTSNTCVPRTAIITPAIGRPLIDERTEPARRAESACACTRRGVQPIKTSDSRYSGRCSRGRRFTMDGTRWPSEVPALLVHPRAARRARVNPVATLLLPRHIRPLALVGQRHLLLHHVACDPHHLVAAHDRVDGVGLPQERLPVGARHLSSREEVPAALAARVAVDHSYRALPPGLLARLLGHDVRRGRLRRIDVGWRDALHDHGRAVHFTDHAPHELGRERTVLEREVATCLLRDDEGADGSRARRQARRGRLHQAYRFGLQREQHHQACRRHDDTPSARENRTSDCLHGAFPRSLMLPDVWCRVDCRCNSITSKTDARIH